MECVTLPGIHNEHLDYLSPTSVQVSVCLLLESHSRCSRQALDGGGSRADMVNANFPVKKLKYKEGGHPHEVSRSLGVQLALEVRPASCQWSPGKGRIGSILS